MERYFCIHGHFYQPPRENPWLEMIERQDSAYPYHDWNERIDAECYAPNAAARILDNNGLIDLIVSNYEQISFDFGPTLLSWLESHAPVTYHAVLEADIESRRRFSGHGAAMAQAYNHLVLPLANYRDKVTQIVWGIRDFEYRFRRRPEGMWLPEAGVDLETLDIAAEHGIAFTVLAPHQAQRVRKIGGRSWKDVNGHEIDPTQPYQVALPSGRTIAVFFYDGPVSRGIAFEGLLRDGGQFANRLLGLFNDDSPHPQLVNVATDGETFGHHHRFGEMALAYALRAITADRKARVTNYGEYLAMYPPTHEVEIVENSSWSCAHGIERWRSDCGCNTGGQPGWTQEWRAPLRAALDWLRDSLAPTFDRLASTLLTNPWKARDDYINVILNRSDDSIADFLKEHQTHPLDDEDITRVLRLLEMQRNAMLMYTSCAWFFNDISGIETIQVMQYAARVIQLAEDVSGESYESRFVAMLEQAKSNIRDHKDGRHIYEEFVAGGHVELETIAAHFGINALFREGGLTETLGCFEMEDGHSEIHTAGKARLALGAVKVRSQITRNSGRFAFAALHLGDHNVTCSVRDVSGTNTTVADMNELLDVFRRNDVRETLRRMESQDEASTFTLETLFGDEQRRILRHILSTSLGKAESIYRGIYKEHAPSMRFVTRLHMPPPLAFLTAAEFVINEELRRAVSAHEVDLAAVNDLLTEARRTGVALDETSIGFALGRNLNATMQELFGSPLELGLLEKASALASLIQSLRYRIDLREAQNTCYEMRQWIYPEVLIRSQRDDTEAKWWVERFGTLAAALWIHVNDT
ncbi:MAG: DUF3536 domain-containing protein [candidate division Zixibacteria bacterium]|nr:DUF3536 domain-containing protein [candidate division Zixibacteria bacterium]